MKIFFSCIVLSFLVSCHSGRNRKEMERFISEWIGKEILIPSDIPVYYKGKDSTHFRNAAVPYKILLYTDSVGCMSCSLKLMEWKLLMSEVKDSLLLSDKVRFDFFFHLKSEKELYFLLKRDRFDCPVYIDKGNRIYNINHLPADERFQCFLLDENNKVLAIGNPVHNPEIWSLYKRIITGKVDTSIKTTATLEPSLIELKDMKVNRKSKTTFVVHNTGNEPLIIKKIVSNCDCTVPVWEQSPIKPGSETKVEIFIQPDHPGIFHKTVQVYCNVKDKRLQLVVKGDVN